MCFGILGGYHIMYHGFWINPDSFWTTAAWYLSCVSSLEFGSITWEPDTGWKTVLATWWLALSSWLHIMCTLIMLEPKLQVSHGATAERQPNQTGSYCCTLISSSCVIHQITLVIFPSEPGCTFLLWGTKMKKPDVLLCSSITGKNTLALSHKRDANAHNWKQMWIPGESRV